MHQEPLIPINIRNPRTDCRRIQERRIIDPYPVRMIIFFPFTLAPGRLQLFECCRRDRVVYDGDGDLFAGAVVLLKQSFWDMIRFLVE